MAKTQRLDKVLAHMGYGTRKELKKLVREGVVTVNGEVVTDSGIHINPEEDVIQVWEEEVAYRQFVYLILSPVCLFDVEQACRCNLSNV